MPYNILPFSIYCLLCLNMQGQYVEDYYMGQENEHFKDGVYLSIEHWHRNNPVTINAIRTDLDPSSFFFYQDLLSEREFYYETDSGSILSFKSNKIFGYSDDHQLYVRQGSRFIRLHITGAICYFAYNKQRQWLNQERALGTVIMDNAYPERHVAHKIIDFETGKK